MPYRTSSHQEIEIILSFNYLNVFKPNEHTEDCHIRKPKDENVRVEIEDENYVYVGEKLFIFETNDIIVKQSIDLGSKDFKFPHVYDEENILFLLYQKYFPILGK